jgi:hypothetical protein
MTNQTRNSQIEGIATLLVLNDEIRKLGSIREFGFYVTNETHHLIPYHTAYLWAPNPVTGIDLISHSGVADIDTQAPASLWLIDAIKNILSTPQASTIHQINTQSKRSDILGAELNLYAINAHDDFADNVLWCPFTNKSNEITGGLILFREDPFSQDEIKMIAWLIASYEYTWNTLLKSKKIQFLKKLRDKPVYTAIALAALVVLLFPTRLTVFGTGTVTPKDPFLINAPMQGVIKSVEVNPGQVVTKGQLLLTLDQTDLNSQLEVDKRDYQLTQTKLRSAINAGFDDKVQQSDIPILRAQLEIDRAHFDYTSSLLLKTSITSPVDGVVVFNSKEDWIGQPIQTGERILVIADPNKVELKITLPVTNFMKLDVGDAGNFYLYGQLSPISIKIRTLGYNAEIQPNKTLGYTFVADFVKTKSTPPLGAQGNVEVYSRHVPFFYYILRRPLQSIRRSLGI